MPNFVRQVLHSGDGDRVHADAVQLLGGGRDVPAHKLPGAFELREVNHEALFVEKALS